MKLSSFLSMALAISLAPLEVGATDSHPTTPAEAGPPALSLTAALAELEAKNPGLTAAQAHVREADARISEARSALFPSLVATGSYVRNNAEVAVRLGSFLSQIPGAPNISDLVIQPLDAWTATGVLSVPILVPTAFYDIDAAKAGQKATEASTDVATRELRTNFVKIAYQAEALREVVSASERAVQLAAEQAASAERRVKSGTAAPLDVLRAKAEQVKRESDLARARADVERAQLALGILLGRKTPVAIVVPELTPDTPMATARSKSGARRPELDVLQARADAARSQMSSARARHLPRLHALGSIFVSDEPYPTGDHSGWRVGVELTLPLYDGGYRYGRRREAEAELQGIQAELSERKLAIHQEVSDAKREIEVAKERQRLAHARKELAADAAASAKRSYDAGISTTLDVLDANDKLYQADVAMAQAKAQLAESRIELERALGTGP